MSIVSAGLDIFQHLKAGTADIHRRIEEKVPVFRPGFALPDYIDLIERYYGFWAPFETKLSLLTGLEDAQLDLAGRLKTPLLAEDLTVVGRNPFEVQCCDRLPGIDNLQRGLGCLYVLEGSTLGSRLIAPRIEKELQLRAGSGASFFNAYGESVGQRWREFKTFVREHARETDTEEIVTAARETFECFYEWL